MAHPNSSHTSQFPHGIFSHSQILRCATKFTNEWRRDPPSGRSCTRIRSRRPMKTASAIYPTISSTTSSPSCRSNPPPRLAYSPSAGKMYGIPSPISIHEGWIPIAVGAVAVASHSARSAAANRSVHGVLVSFAEEAAFGGVFRVEASESRVESPSVEELSLESCFQLQDLEIRVHKLKKLRVWRCFDACSVSSRVTIEAPNLRIMLWSNNAVTEECILHNLTHLQHLSAANIISVWNFLAGLSYCHSLTLETQCIEILSKHNHFAGLSLCSFNKLKSLEFSTAINNHNNSGLATIFRSSPTIHTITIKITGHHNAQRRQWNKDLWQSPSSGEERYWESQTQYLNSFLHHLKVVKIHGFTECANDVSLVKFFLKHAKVLQEVFLCTSLSKPRDSLLREKIKSQIMGFSRASSNANIVFTVCLD